MENMSENLTPMQREYLDKMIAEYGVEYTKEFLRRMALYLGTDEERASLRGLPPLEHP
jgi:hypothetical protein